MAITQVRPSVSNTIRIATKSSATTMFIGGSGTGDEAIQAGDLVIVHGMQKGGITANNASCQINNSVGTYLTPMPNGGIATTSGNAIVKTFNRRYHMAWFRVLTSSDITSGLLTLYWTNGGGLDIRGNFALSVFRGVDTSNIMVNGTPSSQSIRPINSVTFSTVVDSANDNDTFTWDSWDTTYNTLVTNTSNYPGEVTAFAIGSCDRGNFDDNAFTGGEDATQQLASDNVTVNPIGEYDGQGISTLQLIRSFTNLSDATTGTNNLATPWSVTSTGSGDNHRDCTFWFLLPAAATATDHVETFTDSATATDTLSVIHGVARTSTETDSTTTTDTLSAIHGVARTSTETDASTVTDSLSVIHGVAHTFTATDASTTTDTLTVLETGTAHTFTRTDSASSTDLLTVVETGTDHTFSRTDSASTSDVLTATETAGGTPHTFSRTDSASASDSLATVETGTDHTFSQTDSATASDSLTVVETGTAHTFSQTDSATSADLLTRGYGRLFSETDSASVTESLSVVETGTDYTFGETDSASVADILTAQEAGTQHTFGETDTSSVADTLTTQHDAVFTAIDQSTVVDTLNTSEQGQSFFDETDSSTASDTLSVTKEAQSSNTDSTEVSDTLSVEKSISSEEQDTSEVSDSLSTTVQHSAFITDSTSSSDTLFAPTQKEVFITDTSESGDTVFPIKTITVGLLDTVSGSDLVGSQTDREIILTDTVSVLDELLAVGPETTEIIATIIGNGGIDFNLMKEAQAVATIDVWNVALNALGISTLATTEGNNPQQTLLSNTFSLFRKQFLSDHLWNGAKRTTDLTKLDVNTTDQSVANRWKYVYVLPTDCMRVWRLNGQENKPVHVGGNSNIYTNRWEIEVVTKGTTGGDTNTGRYRALCTNQDEARIEYVFDVSNDIDLLGPLTQHAMGLALAAFVATNFGKSASEIAQLEAQAKDAITAAKGVDGQEGTPQIFGDTSLLGVRSIGY